ncbi:hypothetical protein IPZ58_05205 [Streptomyces roseoverticillatus]|uniref:hypothetical protein n=1 Tax=Streptomyces roseoverticillatus TaxID=66429 RepID=UPI001F32C304|nr:hypothetical protein [Streptomyces roseoverticillatus]MCF3100972.1 hypothetical protein [Streptomyces roseoverticillatus]
MNAQVRDVLNLLMDPPGCRRAGKTSLGKDAGSWAVLTFEPPGQGTGREHSYDSTGTAMSNSLIRVTAPRDGLYEVTAGAVIGSYQTGGKIGYARVAIAKGITEGAQFEPNAFLKFGCHRIWDSHRSGTGTATIPLRAGEWIALAGFAEGAAWMFSDDKENAGAATFLSMQWVGEYP